MIMPDISRTMLVWNSRLEQIAQRVPVPPISLAPISFLLSFSSQPFPLVLIDDIFAAPEIRFLRLWSVSPFDDFPAKDHAKVQRYSEVASLWTLLADGYSHLRRWTYDEVLIIKRPSKNVKVLRQRDQAAESKSNIAPP